MKKKMKVLTTAIAVLTLTVSFWLMNSKAENNQSAAVLNGEKAVENLKQNGEYDSLAAAIRVARYSVEEYDGKFYAPNPANKMRAIFEDADGFRLQTADDDLSWQSDWKLKSIGRGAEQQNVIKGAWRTNETKISARHRIASTDGETNIEEYFENRPDGLEQVFVIDKNPASANAETPLRFVLETGGDLKASATADGQAVDLADKSGAKILRYEKLKVWDANGTILAANMRTETAGEVWLEVEDRNAVYPLTVDPSFVQQYKLTRPDSASGDNFGETIAIGDFGKYLAIGAPNADVGGNADQGAVYIFQRNNTTLVWTFQQKITASDGAAGDNFGSGLSGGDLRSFWVGAPNDNIGANADQGSAYKFQYSSTTGIWIQSLKTLATDGTAADNFGSAIAYNDGNTVFISAPNDDVNGITNQGSVYWIRDDGAHRKRLNAADGQANDNFGRSIAVAGDTFSGDLTLISGVPRDDNGSATDQGSVYILKYDTGANTWTQTQKLLASDGEFGDNFGASVFANYAGSELYIGATSDDIGANSGQGSVYYYAGSNGTFSFSKKLTASDGAAFDRFGSSLGYYSFFDSILVVGSPFADIGGNQNQGAIYTFNKITDNGVVTFRQSSKRSSPDGAANDHFGSAVILSNLREMIVSSPDDDVASNVDQGSVSILRRVTPYDFDGDNRADISVFRPSNGAWYLNQSTNGFTGVTFGQNGDQIAPADFDGDGKTDVAVFRPANGAWYYLKSSNNSFVGLTFGQAGDIPIPGDYDGDGRADINVFRPSNGAWYRLNSSNNQFVGLTFGQNGDKPLLADYDGDGKADIAVFRPSTGSFYSLDSSTGNFKGTAFGFGTDIPTPGDFDGDGKTDISVFRPSNGSWYRLNSRTGEFFGVAFGTNGDIPVVANYDGDVRDDIGVFRPSNGAWYYIRSNSGNFEGQTFGLGTDKPIQAAFNQ